MCTSTHAYTSKFIWKGQGQIGTGELNGERREEEYKGGIKGWTTTIRAIWVIIWKLITAKVFKNILTKFKLEAPNNEDNAPT